MSEPRIIELDPEIWLRASQDSYLLKRANGSRQQCCIGIAATSFGMSDDALSGHGTVTDLDFDAVPPELLHIAKVEHDDDGYASIDDDRLGQVYHLNDDEEITDDSERVRLINIELDRIGASFRFALKGRDK